MTTKEKQLWTSIFQTIKDHEDSMSNATTKAKLIANIQDAINKNDLELAKKILNRADGQITLDGQLLADIKELTAIRFNTNTKQTNDTPDWFLSTKLEPDKSRSIFNPWAWLIRVNSGYFSENIFQDYSDLNENVDFFLPYYNKVLYVTWPNIKVWINTLYKYKIDDPRWNVTFSLDELKALKKIINDIDRPKRQNTNNN